MSFFVSVLALFFSLTIALKLPMNHFLISTIIGGIFVLIPIFCLRTQAMKSMRNANLINEQLQKELLSIYPEYKNKHR
jgi:hypothetical protein